MNNKIYVILVLDNKFDTSKISQEGYTTLEKAQEFCKTRENKNIIESNPYTYIGDRYNYYIIEVNII